MEDQIERRIVADIIYSEELEGFDETEHLEGTVFNIHDSTAHVGPQFNFEGPVIFADTERSGRKTVIEQDLLSVLDGLQQVDVDSGKTSQSIQAADELAVGVKQADSTNETVSTKQKFMKCKFTRNPTLKLLLTILKVKLVMMITTAIIVVPIIGTLAIVKGYTSEPDCTDELSIQLKTPPCNLTLVPRRKWEAAPSNCSPLLKKVHKYHLVKKVVINDAATQKCRIEKRCSRTVKRLQKDHHTSGYCDITFNFLIAKGGYVYEGKGMSHQENFQQDFSAKDLVLNIGLMGSFPEGKPADLVAAIQCLIKAAQAQGFVDEACTIKSY